LKDSWGTSKKFLIAAGAAGWLDQGGRPSLQQEALRCHSHSKVAKDNSSTTKISSKAVLRGHSGRQQSGPHHMGHMGRMCTFTKESMLQTDSGQGHHAIRRSGQEHRNAPGSGCREWGPMKVRRPCVPRVTVSMSCCIEQGQADNHI